MSIRTSGSLVAGTLLLLSATVGVAPLAGAAPTVDQSREVTFVCNSDELNQPTVSPNTFTVSAPESVAPGEFFTVGLQPGQMRSSSATLARLSLDVALPTNAEIVSVSLAGGSTGLAGTAPSVVRVNPTTKVNDNSGSVARI